MMWDVHNEVLCDKMVSELTTIPPSVISIRSDLDIVVARMAARDVARHLGFNKIDQARISTATSELARSIVMKAVEGTVTIGPIQRGNRSGIEVIVDDYCSGMPDVSALLQDGSQHEQHTGPGLATSRRLMDELNIDTRLEQGTTVTCRKWLR